VPPPVGKDRATGDGTTAHAGNVVVCLSWNVVPAIVADAERGEVDLFAVHWTVTVLGPLPAAGETVSQEPFPTAVQSPPAQLEGEPVRVTS